MASKYSRFAGRKFAPQSVADIERAIQWMTDNVIDIQHIDTDKTSVAVADMHTKIDNKCCDWFISHGEHLPKIVIMMEYATIVGHIKKFGPDANDRARLIFAMGKTARQVEKTTQIGCGKVMGAFLITEAWMLQMSADTDGAPSPDSEMEEVARYVDTIGRPSEHPDRIEVLMVDAINMTSTEPQNAIIIHEIVRHGESYDLKDHSRMNFGEAEGHNMNLLNRFVDGYRAADK